MSIAGKAVMQNRARALPGLSRRDFNRGLIAAVGGLVYLPAGMAGAPLTSPPPSGDIPYGDVDQLIARGWVPGYRKTAKAYHAVEQDAERFTPNGEGGERNEIGLVPEEYAAWIATRDARYRTLTLKLADTIPREDWKNKALMTTLTWQGGKWGIEYAHTPCYWYCAHLETGDPWYIFPAEQIYRWYMQWLYGTDENAAEELYSRDMGYGYNGRHYAWMMRNLARLARLQSLGLTQHSYYQGAMRANLDYMLSNFVHSPDPLRQEWRVIGWNKGAMRGSGHHYFTAWMESFIGQTLGHMVGLGFKEWLPISAWHFGQLTAKIDAWGIKGVDNSHYHIEAEKPYTYKGREPYLKSIMTSAFRDWPRDKLIPTNMRDAKGNRYTYENRAQYAQGWAALAADAGVKGAGDVAKSLDAAIAARGDVRDYKNAPVY